MKARFGSCRHNRLVGLCALVGPAVFATAIFGPQIIERHSICRAADEPAHKPAAADKNAAKSSPTDSAAKSADSARDPKTSDEDFELFKSLADTIDQVERNYVKPIDRRELMEAAIKGILTKL